MNSLNPEIFFLIHDKFVEEPFIELTDILLNSEIPSDKIKELVKIPINFKPLEEIILLKGLPQNPKWHPEGDVFTHTLLVVDRASELKSHFESITEKAAYMYGALCHDFGKISTTKKIFGKIRSFAHDKEGIGIAENFLKRASIKPEIITEITNYVRHHMKPGNLYKTKEQVSLRAIKRLSDKINIEKLILLSKADHFGRTTPDAIAKEFPAGDWLMSKFNQLKTWEIKEHKIFNITGNILSSIGIKQDKKLKPSSGQ
jgi:tRNA nucleotidyltransferase (CCA-adding enzyme)